MLKNVIYTYSTIIVYKEDNAPLFVWLVDNNIIVMHVAYVPFIFKTSYISHVKSYGYRCLPHVWSPSTNPWI